MCDHPPEYEIFDRTICYCGAMHYYCGLCGALVEECVLD